MKNSNYTIGNRTRDLPACNAVPQPTALPRAPERAVELTYIRWRHRKAFLALLEVKPNPTTHSIPSDRRSCCTQKDFRPLDPSKGQWEL